MRRNDCEGLNMNEKKVGVDSGMLLIVDPCYLGHELVEQLWAHRREDGSFDTSFLTPNAGRDICAIVSTGGDGLFAVEWQDGP